MKTHAYHEKAKLLVKNYLNLEVELIQLLQKIEAEKIYLDLGFGSMHAYCLSLGLSDSQSYRMIGVSRSCVKFPQLEKAIVSGELNPSRAKKILSVLDKDPQEWIEKAKSLPTKELEREVALSNPEKAIPERIKPVTPTRLELKCGMSPELEKKLNRCKELLMRQGNYTWESVLESLTDHFLKTKDPVEKAQRAKPPQQQSPRTATRYLPSSLRHEVNRRDKGACRYLMPNQKPCGSRVFTEIHHIVPISYGGKHTLENLTTFCSAHHHQAHKHQFQRANLTSKDNPRS